MNILVLSNGAPNYHNFFNALAQELSKKRNSICYAVDSKVSLSENKVTETGFEYEVFSEFFQSHAADDSILAKYRHYNLNRALLSDFERWSIYNKGASRENEYYHNLKSALLSFFTAIIESNKIDAVIYENISNSFSYFCWFVCQQKGIPYVGLTASRLPGRFWITDEPLDEHKIISNALGKISSGAVEPSPESRRWCEDYIQRIDKTAPDYMQFNNLGNVSIFKKYATKSKLKKVITGLKHLTDRHEFAYQRGNPLFASWRMFRRSLERKARLSRLNRLYEKAVPGEDYLLYPLHFHPESSTSILSAEYLNEYEVIQTIAFNLPEGFKLYVKDHISAHGYPSLEFYRSLIALPNVRLLAPTAPTKTLIKNSAAVITLTSTVGYEAVLLNKRVFLFGSVFYEDHRNVIKIGDPSKIFETLSNNIKIEETIDSLRYNIDFVGAILLSSYPGTLNLMLEETQAKALASEIAPTVLTHLKSIRAFTEGSSRIPSRTE